MYLLALTTVENNEYTDHYQLAETLEELVPELEFMQDNSNVYAWAYTKVLTASEPHWEE